MPASANSSTGMVSIVLLWKIKIKKKKNVAAEINPVTALVCKMSGLKSALEPAPVAQWLARRTVGRKVWGSNPIRVMWDFSALAGSYPELGVLWAQWEGWNHTAELHPLHGCVFEGVALIT